MRGIITSAEKVPLLIHDNQVDPDAKIFLISAFMPLNFISYTFQEKDIASLFEETLLNYFTLSFTRCEGTDRVKRFEETSFIKCMKITRDTRRAFLVPYRIRRSVSVVAVRKQNIVVDSFDANPHAMRPRRLTEFIKAAKVRIPWRGLRIGAGHVNSWVTTHFCTGKTHASIFPI